MKDPLKVDNLIINKVDGSKMWANKISIELI